MTLTTVALNGTPIEDLGLGLCGLEGWHEISRRTYPTVSIPLQPGVRPMSSGSTLEPRALDLKFLVSPSSVTDRTTKLDALAEYFGGQVEVTVVDAPNRVVFGLLEAMPVRSPWKAFVNMSVYADCRIVCHNPLWFDKDPQITWIPAALRVALTMGTGPVRRITLSIVGGSANPVLILRDQSGTEVQRMTLTGSPTSSQRVEIDCDAYSITLQPAGTDLLAANWLATTETFLEMRPPYRYSIECAQDAMVAYHYRTYVT